MTAVEAVNDLNTDRAATKRFTQCPHTGEEREARHLAIGGLQQGEQDFATLRAKTPDMLI